MRLRSLLAAVLGVLMITSCMSFTVGAQAADLDATGETVAEELAEGKIAVDEAMEKSGAEKAVLAQEDNTQNQQSITYKTYGTYDAASETYTVELKFSGTKAHIGSFGFYLPGLQSVIVNEAAGINLFAEEEAEGVVVSPIFARGEDHYANTWAIEAEPGYIDATQEEVLIATFELEIDELAVEDIVENGLDEYVVVNADAKYHNGDNYLTVPHKDDLQTDKLAIEYAGHTHVTVSYNTYGTYNPTYGTYTIDVKVKGDKINVGAFGLAFNSAYMTYDPEAENALVLADGISNYLGVTLANTADGVAFVWDGSGDAENGYVDATAEEVLIATITATMTEAQREAYEAANTPEFEMLDITGTADVGKYFNGTDYLVAVYESELAVERVAAPYTGHEDDVAEEVTTADVTVEVTFSEKLGATNTNIGYITVNDGEAVVIDDEGNTEKVVEYIIEDVTVGQKLNIRVEKNGYLAGVCEITVAEGENTVEMTLLAGDIKGSETVTCGDGTVDLDDFVRIIRAFDSGASDEFKAAVDLDESGLVNVTDLGIIKANYNKTTADNTIVVNGETVSPKPAA